jgi:hypothetical protein
VSDITEVGLETWKDSRENGVEEWDELDQDISVASPIFPMALTRTEPVELT